MYCKYDNMTFKPEIYAEAGESTWQASHRRRPRLFVRDIPDQESR